jgi:hypothetical protein
VISPGGQVLHSRIAALQDLTPDPLEAQRAKEWFSTWVSKTLANDADAQDGRPSLKPGALQLAPGARIVHRGVFSQ